jgi:HEAT repeat protein
LNAFLLFMLRLLKGRRKTLWILLGCAIAIVLLLTFWREREPEYKGRSLSQWIALLDGGYGNDPDIWLTDAQRAVRAIGTNGLPFLVKWLNYRERPWRTRLDSLCNKLPDTVANPLSRLIVDGGAQRQRAAFTALCFLGADARPAIPALTNLLSGQPQLADTCMFVLVQLGDEGLPPVLCVLTNRANPARFSAVMALEYSGAKYTFNQGIAEILSSCLEDTNSDVACQAAALLCSHQVNQERALRTFVEALESNDKQRKHNAVSILSTVLYTFSSTNLIQLLQDTNSVLSPHAARALGGKFDSKNTPPEIVLSALTNSLRDPRPLVRSYAADAVGRFREAAEPAAPALLDLWDDPDNAVRQSATNAFYELPSYSFLRVLGPWPIGMSQEQADMWIRRYGLPRSTALTKLLDNPDPRIRQMATNAVQKLTIARDQNQTAENPSH